MEDILKYGYGLLDLTSEELKTIELGDFMERVAGKLLWRKEDRETQLKTELEFQSWFTANIMQSSGNYKKSVDAGDLKDGIYNPEEMFGDGTNEKKDSKDRKIEYSQGKQDLLDRFGLEE